MKIIDHQFMSLCFKTHKLNVWMMIGKQRDKIILIFFLEYKIILMDHYMLSSLELEFL